MDSNGGATVTTHSNPAKSTTIPATATRTDTAEAFVERMLDCPVTLAVNWRPMW